MKLDKKRYKMDKLKKLLEELAPKVKDYEARQKERMVTGFNLFYLISDYYYRETFHSDIIAAILDPKGKHENGKGYIDLFIDMINKKIKVPVIKDYYSVESTVITELPTDDGELHGRIDIFIEGDIEDKDGKRHCVVIENKLNNAGDTHRQLPKYYGFLKDKYNIDAFVYLPLDPNKMPDKTGWTDDEICFIDSKFVKIPAYIEGKINLIDHWLTPAEKEGNDDAKFVISQYNKVLKNLTIDYMSNKVIVDVLVSSEDNFESTLGIIENLNSFYEKVKNAFIEDLSSSLGDGLSLNEKNSDCIEIRAQGCNSWKYVIERYSGNNKYWRSLKYEGKTGLNLNTRIWSKPAEKDMPFGWDYFDENKGLCYWNSPCTLREMRNGNFTQIIVEEVKKSFSQIDEQNLPK